MKSQPMGRPIRVLLAKATLDSHDRGVRFLARTLRDAGFEVILVNFLLTEEVVNVAVEEDVDVVGISSSSGGHMPVFEGLIEGMKKNGLEDVLVLGGGIIPPNDVRSLKELGVAAFFGPGATPQEAIQLIRERVHRP